MYLSSSSKSYEKKYLKYKNKYKILKSQFGGAKGTLHGGDCSPLPNPEEEDLVTAKNLLDLCPEERITIQNKCYEVKSLHNWIIEGNHDRLFDTQTLITPEDKQRLLEAYDELPLLPNKLTRDKLIQIYLNLQQEIIIDLSREGYTDIAPGTFSIGTFDDNLPNLRDLSLRNNQIKKLQSGTFNNLLRLVSLDLSNNKIIELQLGIFNNLPRLEYLFFDNNQIIELHRDTFNNLPNLRILHLDYNQIRELQPDIFTMGMFGNFQFLTELWLNNNQIRELQPGTFNNLPRLEKLWLNNNQIRELQPDIFNNLPNLIRLYLNNNQIIELQPGIFNNLLNLKKIILYNNQIRELQPDTFSKKLKALQLINLTDNPIRELQSNSYYGLPTHVQIKILDYDPANY